MDKIWIITKLILKRLFVRPANILLHIVMPIVASVGLFLLMGLNSGTQLHIAISDGDMSKTSQDMIQVLDSKEGFELHAINSFDIDDAIKNNHYALGIKIPVDFEDKILNDEEPAIQIVNLKETDNYEWISALINQEIHQYLTISQQSFDKEAYYQALENISKGIQLTSQSVIDESVEKNSLIRTFGNYLLLLMISTFLIAFRIIDEKERGTFYRIGMTSVHPRIYIVANILAGTLIAMTQIALVLLSLRLIGVNFYASILMIYVLLSIFALCAISLSVFIAVSASSTTAANATIGFIVSPSCMLAGCMWPIEFMPDFLQKAAYLMPQRWVLDGIKLLQRNHMMNIIPNIMVVIGFTSLFFLFTVYKLKSEDNIYN